MTPSPSLDRRLRSLARWRLVLDLLARCDPFYKAEQVVEPKRIVVPLLWGLGDGVLALPLIDALRQKWPTARIDVLGKPSLVDIVSAPQVCVRYLNAPWTAASGKYRIWDHQWRQFFSDFHKIAADPIDLWVNLRLDPREILLARMMRPKHIIGLGEAGARSWLGSDMGLNSAQFFQRYGGEIAASAAFLATGMVVRPEPSLPQNETRIARGRNLVGADQPFALLAFGASHPTRHWAPEKIQFILDAMSERNIQVVLVHPPNAQTEMRPGPALKLPQGTTSWSGDLGALIDVIGAARVFIGSDSGPMHIAAALDIPVIAAFGPGSLEVFGPRRENVELIHVEPMPCRPCFDSCIYSSPKCLDLLEPQALLSALDRLILANKVRIT